MKRKDVKCGFCKGMGKDPFKLLSECSVCQVCNGEGKVEIAEPAIECVFCEGSGIYPGKRITCTVCGGKGMITVEKNVTEKCPDCKGSGATADSGLPCLKCKGKGVIATK